MSWIWLSRKEIDDIAWDKVVETATFPIFYAHTWYLDAICPTWEGMVYNNYEAIMPVPIHYKYGIRYSFHPFQCQQLGVFSAYEISPLCLEEALLLLVQKIPYLNSYRFNEGNNFSQVKQPQNTQLKVCYNHILPLQKNYQALYENYKTDRKINLKRAKNTAWRIEETHNIDWLIDLHQEHNELKITGQKNIMPVENYHFFKQAYQVLEEKKKGKLWAAYHENELQAGALFVEMYGRIIYLFNGSSLEGRKKQARLLMIDALIEKYANSSYIFDFESPVDAPFVSDYYASFGSIAKPYMEFSYNHLPTWIQALMDLRNKYSKAM